MLQKAQEIYAKVLKAHREIYSKLAPLRATSARLNDIKELADTAYAMNKAYAYLDDLRKEVKGTKELCERMACLLWAKLNEGDPIRTKHVTATPNIKMTASVPKRHKDPEKFEALMRFLKIPQELWELEVVRPHWPSFIEYTSKRLEAGLPLPDGIDPSAVYPVYSLILRGRLEVQAGYEGSEEKFEIPQVAKVVEVSDAQKREEKRKRKSALALRLGFSSYAEFRKFMN